MHLVNHPTEQRDSGHSLTSQLISSFGNMGETAPQRGAFERILLATDLTSISALAAQYATRLAVHNSAHLSALYVFNPLRLPSSDSVGAHATPNEVRLRDAERLEALLESIRTQIPNAEKQILDGEPTPEVINYAQQYKADLIITGTHGGRGLDRLLLGSTAEAIVRKSPCPVLTVGPNVTLSLESGKPFSRIVCAMDFGDAAKSAVPVAIDMANESNAHLRFLHVLPSALNNGQPQPLVEQLFHNAMNHVISNCQVKAPIECQVRYGARISDTILQDALHERADLIILGVRRRNSLASRLPAGIAFQVIEGATCPVMTISD